MLYFPKIKQSYSKIQKNKDPAIATATQVFVTDEVKDIVPEFLMLLHGVIDSPDVPLNISRKRSTSWGEPEREKDKIILLTKNMLPIN